MSKDRDKNKEKEVLEHFAKSGDAKDNYRISQSYPIKATMTGKIKVLKLQTK